MLMMVHVCTSREENQIPRDKRCFSQNDSKVGSERDHFAPAAVPAFKKKKHCSVRPLHCDAVLLKIFAETTKDVESSDERA